MKILDSSVVILFLDDIDEEGCLYMLSEIGEILLLPESVYDEVLDEDTKSKMNSLISKGILRKIEGANCEENILKRRFLTLGNGEINVLACGKNLQKQEKIWCVIDETHGRNAAEKLGIPLTGSIGLIKILKEKRVLNEDKLKNIVNKIRESPFWIDKEILRGLLNE